MSIVPSRAPEGPWDPGSEPNERPPAVQLLAQRPASRRSVRSSVDRCGAAVAQQSSFRRSRSKGDEEAWPKRAQRDGEPARPRGQKRGQGGESRLGLVGRGRRRTTARASKARRGRSARELRRRRVRPRTAGAGRRSRHRERRHRRVRRGSCQPPPALTDRPLARDRGGRGVSVGRPGRSAWRSEVVAERGRCGRLAAEGGRALPRGKARALRSAHPRHQKARESARHEVVIATTWCPTLSAGCSGVVELKVLHLQLFLPSPPPLLSLSRSLAVLPLFQFGSLRAFTPFSPLSTSEPKRAARY